MTGAAPQKTAAFAVAAKVIAGTITSSPGPIPSDAYAACNAAVPLFTATACFVPTNDANASSNSVTFGPVVSQSEHITSLTAFTSSSLIN